VVRELRERLTPKVIGFCKSVHGTDTNQGEILFKKPEGDLPFPFKK